MRFTKNNRQQVLDANENFTRNTYHSERNFEESRTYTVSGGQLHIRAKGKTSWADSRYDETYSYGADDEETKRFLRKYKDQLNLPEE